MSEYLVTATRQANYPMVKPKRLAVVLDKLSKYGLDRSRKGDAAVKELGERRRKESDSVGRIYPGESR